jgi:hypothetical protein
MAEIGTALAASRDAIEQLIIAGERTGAAWAAPRASGKWSPSQIVEHVARSLEESANMAAGRPSTPGARHSGMVKSVTACPARLTSSSSCSTFSTTDVSDIDYFHTSRLLGEPAGGSDDVHTHPALPRSARFGLQLSF